VIADCQYGPLSDWGETSQAYLTCAVSDQR